MSVWKPEELRKFLKPLINEKFRFKNYTEVYENTEHDHCMINGEEISSYEGCLRWGYTSTSEKHEDYWWICPACFEQYKDVMGWEVIE